MGPKLGMLMATIILGTAALAAQNSSQSKPPDMVCFGNDPNWSIQFTSGVAVYLGINQPDQSWPGGFTWVPNIGVWAWHRSDLLPSNNNGFALSAFIRKASCTDPVRHQKFPYTAEVNMPQGDMVGGCCRKLKPGEAAVGKHGVPAKP